MKRLGAVAWSLTATVLTISCSDGAKPRAVDPGPSVLLVTLDTTRADRLGAYGSAIGATPHLDGLASRGVLFEQAFAVAPMTLPAHASILTGQLPTRTGLRWNGEQRLADSPAEMPTLAERFRAAGYATAAFVSAAVLDRAFGLDRGFELYDDGDHPGERSRSPADRWKTERPASQTVARALSWLATQPAERPVFLWVHLFDPHDPYLPPAPFAARFADDPYSGEIAAADDAVGILLAESRFRPGAPAIVSVIGDHGEGLGEHGEATHGILLHDATLRVPWILAAPELAALRVETAVSQVDLAPTLLALTRLPALAVSGGMGGKGGIDGIDLGGELRGAAADRTRTLYAESVYANVLYGWAPLRSARRASYKWVEGLHGELFDFIVDPGETRNLANALPAEAGALARALAGLRASESGRSGASGQVDAELAESLRSLGYIAGGSAMREQEATADPRHRIAVHEGLRAVDAQWRRGEVGAAELALDTLFAADPGNRLLQEVVERQLRGAIAHLEATAATEATEATDAATTAALQIRLAQLLALGGRRDEARELLELAANPAGTPATRSLANLSLATLALGERRFGDAERLARAAVELEPGSALAWNTLAIALDDLERPAEAEAAYRAALRLDPALYRSELNLAQLLAGQPARRSEAAEHLRRFLARAPAGDPRAAEARAALAHLSSAGRGGG